MKISELTLLGLNIIFKFLPYCITLWQKHRKSASDKVVHHKKIHILADLSVVSFLSFLKKLQMCFEFLRCWETYSVNSLKHLIAAVALPICA